MTQPTPEELLRLARKACPEDDPGSIRHSASNDGDIQRVLFLSVGGRQIDLVAVAHNAPLSLAALHAALLVLSGELDVAALLAERDRLRDRVHDAIGKCYSLSQPDRDALYAALEDP